MEITLPLAKIIAMCLASFSLGLSLCAVIYAFCHPRDKH